MCGAPPLSGRRGRAPAVVAIRSRRESVASFGPGALDAGNARFRGRSARFARGGTMNPTGLLHRAGQSLWLDNITRDLLTSGTLERYARELAVTGLTSNPTIYDRAIGGTSAYDKAIGAAASRGTVAEEIFFGLALDDLREAADIFRPVFDRTGGVDGYVSLEVSPVLAYDATATALEAARLHGLGMRPNLFIKIPGTTEGLRAIEDTIFAGVPVNVTLLFSLAQYLGCMEAYTRGI